MKTPFLFKFAAPVILLVFTFVSCSSPFFNNNIPGNSVPVDEIALVPLGKGDARMVFLDQNHELAEEDTGSLALFVENNEMAEGVLVVSEIPNNDLAYGTVVHVLNRNNSSAVSFFYYEDQNFPYKMLITKGGEKVNGTFSHYNQALQNYSVAFQYGESEFEVWENLTLTRNAFYAYHNDSDLTVTQNLRMKNLITTLCIWDSLALQMPGENFKVNAQNLSVGGSPLILGWNPFKSFIVGLFAVVAVVAFVAALIVAPPAAIAVAGASITASLSSATSIGLAVGSLVSATIAVGVAVLMPDEEESPSGGSPSPAPTPQVTIKQDGQNVPNNQLPPYYLANVGDSITFELQFFNIVVTPTINVFDPTNVQWMGINEGKAGAYEYTSTSDETTLYITVRRKETGALGDGKIQYILKFNRTTAINSSAAGVNFREPEEAEARNRKDIFILNFTSLQS